jgi:O-antigen ligase
VIALLTVAALAVVVVAGPKISGDPHVSTAQLSRPAMYAVTVKAVSHFFPLGSGFGSFPPVYRLFEDPNLVTNVFINHTHSDYLELVLEGGIPGVLLVAALLLWWLRRAAAIWFSRSPSRIERAAVIATGAILFHSIVDYPARTSAIAAILGAGLALMVPRSTEAKVEEAPAVGRHLSAE